MNSFVSSAFGAVQLPGFADSQEVSLVGGVVDGQLGAQVMDVGVRSVLQQDVDAV